MSRGTHYSNAFDTDYMMTWAKEQAQILSTHLKRNEIPVLVYSGMSGVSYATHLSIALLKMGIACEHYYVRKTEEKSHGMWVEYSNSETVWHAPQNYALIFVDDFIESGNTLKYVLKTLKEHLKIKQTHFMIVINGTSKLKEVQPYVRVPISQVL